MTFDVEQREAVREVAQVLHLLCANLASAVLLSADGTASLGISDRRNHDFGLFAGHAIISQQIKTNLVWFDSSQYQRSASDGATAIHRRTTQWIRGKIGVDLRRPRPAHTHCSFNLIGEPVKVFVKAAIHVAFDPVCSQIADQRCFRRVGS